MQLSRSQDRFAHLCRGRTSGCDLHRVHGQYASQEDGRERDSRPFFNSPVDSAAPTLPAGLADVSPSLDHTHGADLLFAPDPDPNQKSIRGESRKHSLNVPSSAVRAGT